MNMELKSQFESTFMHLKKLKRLFPAKDDMRFGEAMLLKNLYDGENTDDVCDILHISKPAVSQLLNSLEKKGLIFREIDVNDRRKINIAITPKGKAVVTEHTAFYEKTFERLMDIFGEDNAKEFSRLFDLLINSMATLNKELSE